MAGIYIHIPFCKQSCHYCDFHFSTTFHSYRDRMISAICKEIFLQRNFLNEKVKTIYFGGGTPSLLTKNELEKIFYALQENFDLSEVQEITLEANPDDLNEQHLLDLKAVGINRLSIGIQSFFDEDLQYMNRAHTSNEAERCIQWAKKIGIDNLSIDLIYGFPLLSDEKWISNLNKAIDLGVQHISSYCMTIEKGTALSSFVNKGKVAPMDEEQAENHFSILREKLKAAGYSQYEISNFCLPAFESKHNSSYWLQEKYLGIGPAAHSYDLQNRYWNISNNIKYLFDIEQNELANEKEIINESTAYNEYVLTRLRTIWGIDEADIKKFNSFIQQHFFKNISRYLNNAQIIKVNNSYLLNEEAKFLADGIASDLFVI